MVILFCLCGWQNMNNNLMNFLILCADMNEELVELLELDFAGIHVAKSS